MERETIRVLHDASMDAWRESRDAVVRARDALRAAEAQEERLRSICASLYETMQEAPRADEYAAKARAWDYVEHHAALQFDSEFEGQEYKKLRTEALGEG